MKVTVKELAPCEKLVKVNVPEEVIAEAYDAVYREISKIAKVPGFRPGKVPPDLVRSHYRDEAKEEVRKRLVSKTLHEALEEHRLDPIFHPEIREIDFTDRKLQYSAYVEIRPEVKVGQYLGVKVKKNPVKVEPAEIDRVIDELRKGHATFTPVEGRGLEFGDFFICDLKVFSDGKELESRQDAWIEYQEHGLLPEICSALKGCRAGDEKSVDVDFPKDYGDSKLAEKKGTFKINVKEIKARALPEVTAEWAKEIGDYGSAEDLRQAIERDLAEEKDRQEEHRLQNEILERLLESSKFSVPKRLVDLTAEDLVSEALKHSAEKHAKESDLEAKKKELRGKVEEEAEKRVRLGFLLEKIAENEKIEVVEKDLNDRLDEIAKQVQQPREKVRSYYESKNRLGSLAHDILNKKTLLYLREKADVS
ncbi:MAG TPA: trigger factor [Candidatus Omnitrophota bacterium]|nr:trigger factor [Candidatus Omnitrophota bacterium]